MKGLNKQLADTNRLYLRYGTERLAMILAPIYDTPKSERKTYRKATVITIYPLSKPRKSRLKSPWKIYKKLVDEITKSQPLETLENYDKRGFRGYHLDHMISIHYGYKNGIPPKVIGHISNLRMIPHQENLLKGTKCVFPPGLEHYNKGDE